MVIEQLCMVDERARSSRGDDMLVHEISAPCTIPALDLSKVLFDQIGAYSALLGIPFRPSIVGFIVVKGVFDLLLEPELLKDLGIN